MRLVKRDEFMTLPAGTLFAELNQPWEFAQLCLKGETIVHDGTTSDFLFRNLAWPEADDMGEAVDRLKEMVSDATVSYALDTAYQRHGLFDNDQVFLVLEAADTRVLVKEIGDGCG